MFVYANQHGREMRLIVPSDRSHIEQIGEHVILYHVAAKNSPIADTRYRLLWSFGKTGAEIRDILRIEQPDLVEIADKYTLPLMAGLLRKNWIQGLTKRPALVATSHERMDATTGAYFGWPLVWRGISRVFLKHYYFPMFDAHIANSAYTAEELVPASTGHRLQREIRVLPMGVDADAFTPLARTPKAREALLRRLNLPESSRMLLYAGRLVTEKNLPMLIEALENLPAEYHLLLAGAGPLEPWLRSRDKRMHLLGHVQRDELSGLYAGADAFVHPNAREPFGIAPLEAMAAGLPLVAPNAGGVLSYASPENAWLSEPSAKPFAATIEELFHCREEERQVRLHKARKIAVLHNWPNIAANYFKAFDEWTATYLCCNSQS